MPKVKTKKAASKRFRVTASGRFLRNKAYRRHLKSSKSPKRRRNLRHTGLVDPADAVSVQRMLPYA